MKICYIELPSDENLNPCQKALANELSSEIDTPPGKKIGMPKYAVPSNQNNRMKFIVSDEKSKFITNE